MIIGTCSLCGGPVVTPDVWHGIQRPPRTCERCGAHAVDYGPVIPMTPAHSPRPQHPWWGSGTHDSTVDTGSETITWGMGSDCGSHMVIDLYGNTVPFSSIKPGGAYRDRALTTGALNTFRKPT